jgi:hypothetical protein
MFCRGSTTVFGTHRPATVWTAECSVNLGRGNSSRNLAGILGWKNGGKMGDFKKWLENEDH